MNPGVYSGLGRELGPVLGVPRLVSAGKINSILNASSQPVFSFGSNGPMFNNMVIEVRNLQVSAVGTTCNFRFSTDGQQSFDSASVYATPAAGANLIKGIGGLGFSTVGVQSVGNRTRLTVHDCKRLLPQIGLLEQWGSNSTGDCANVSNRFFYYPTVRRYVTGAVMFPADGGGFNFNQEAEYIIYGYD